eukprot:3712169-Amphidinium_carterae.1
MRATPLLYVHVSQRRKSFEPLACLVSSWLEDPLRVLAASVAAQRAQDHSVLKLPVLQSDDSQKLQLMQWLYARIAKCWMCRACSNRDSWSSFASARRLGRGKLPVSLVERGMYPQASSQVELEQGRHHCVIVSWPWRLVESARVLTQQSSSCSAWAQSLLGGEFIDIVLEFVR